jgi:hypothetical protein
MGVQVLQCYSIIIAMIFATLVDDIRRTDLFTNLGLLHTMQRVELWETL